MPYELYYSPGACSLAAHIVLEEVGAQADYHLVKLADGDHTRPPYLAINPKARVPALRLPGEPRVLTELPAILTYLARSHPERGLIPATAAAEARCSEWLAWLAGWLHGTGYALLWRPARFSADPTQYAALSAQGRQVIEAANAEIEAALADGRDWILGAAYSIVDPFLLVLYRWGNRIGLPMAERYPHWAALARRIAARPAAARTLAHEGVSIDG